MADQLVSMQLMDLDDPHTHLTEDGMTTLPKWDLPYFRNIE